jgi:hypothetical protein
MATPITVSTVAERGVNERRRAIIPIFDSSNSAQLLIRFVTAREYPRIVIAAPYSLVH